MCSIHSVAGGYTGIRCVGNDVEMHLMMFRSSSVAVRTATIPVFQPQTILQVVVEEYFPHSNFYFKS